MIFYSYKTILVVTSCMMHFIDLLLYWVEEITKIVLGSVENSL